MAHEDSPSSVMYAELKELGLKNRDVAVVLLDTTRSFGDGTLMDRIESRTRLTRNIVHVAPGELGSNLFKDYHHSVQVILSRIVEKMPKRKRADAYRVLDERFAGESAARMQRALEAYGADGSVYRNALAHVSNLNAASESDRALMRLMLFVVAGCTGDPHEAARCVEEFSTRSTGTSFKTVVADVETDVEPEDPDTGDFRLGLMRIVNGRLKGPDAFYVLSESEEGTEIGALSAADGAVTDVDEDVSRRHARVFKRGGRWYVVGLGSTNGTTVISGADKLERTVEPPRKNRPRGYESEPFEIFPSDTLCLGVSTRFMVMPVM